MWLFELGRGIVDTPAFVDVLRKADYDGWLTIERRVNIFRRAAAIIRERMASTSSWHRQRFPSVLAFQVPNRHPILIGTLSRPPPAPEATTPSPQSQSTPPRQPQTPESSEVPSEEDTAKLAAKEPFQITKEQYVQRLADETGLDPDADSGIAKLGTNRKVWETGHLSIVRRAIKAGETVPDEVLAGHPSLQSAQEPKDGTPVSRKQQIPSRGKAAKRRGKGADAADVQVPRKAVDEESQTRPRNIGTKGARLRPSKQGEWGRRQVERRIVEAATDRYGLEAQQDRFSGFRGHETGDEQFLVFSFRGKMPTELKEALENVPRAERRRVRALISENVTHSPVGEDSIIQIGGAEEAIEYLRIEASSTKAGRTRRAGAGGRGCNRGRCCPGVRS
ncbi:MAG: hypothetical protein IIB38_04400 [Candidatus Hydrogenedentes bacterium]|nr:hypothetical protein [Candidatus Hydrogenedentota bacterium]